MATLPIVLVPPSEGKAQGGRRGAPGDAEPLARERRAVRRGLRDAMRDAPDDALRSLLKVRGPLLDQALASTRSLLAGKAPLLPAWQRYVGVVWQYLDASTLPSSARRRVLVPSGLYGLTSGDELIADYRLTMSVALPGVGPLRTFWRDPISERIAALAGGRPIIDLLPSEHAACVDYEALASDHEVIRVRFLDASERRAAGHAAKAVKGIVARAVLSDGPAALDGFSWEGWVARRVSDGVEIVSAR